MRRRCDGAVNGASIRNQTQRVCVQLHLPASVCSSEMKRNRSNDSGGYLN